jgi:phage gpG-like protein
MDTRQFERLIAQKAKQIEQYATTKFPTEAGNTALRFVDGNFKAQGWQGQSFQKWKPNKRKDRILVNKGHLRNATYYVTGITMVTIRNTQPYANIHNEGGNIKIPVTDKMRKFAWAMYYKNGGGKAKGKSARASLRNQNADNWKGLALTKKTYLNINIDQRQFAPTKSNPSPILNTAVERGVVRAFKEIFNNV